MSDELSEKVTPREAIASKNECMQHATCNLYLITFKLQSVTFKLACKLQPYPETFHVQPATCNLQLTTYNVKHATYSLQLKQL